MLAAAVRTRAEAVALVAARAAKALDQRRVRCGVELVVVRRCCPFRRGRQDLESSFHLGRAQAVDLSSLSSRSSRCGAQALAFSLAVILDLVRVPDSQY